MRGVQRLVVLERGVGEQWLEQFQAGGGPGREPDRDGTVELNDGRRADHGEGAVELGDLRPVVPGTGSARAVIAACSWYSPGRRIRTARSSFARPSRIRS